MAVEGLRPWNRPSAHERQPTFSEITGSTLRAIVAQIGARRHYAIPVMLDRAGMLQRLYTDLCAEDPCMRMLGALLPETLRTGAMKKALARKVTGVPRKKIRCFPLFTLRRMFARREDRSPADSYRQWLQANRQFDQLVVRAGFGEADTVYVFNGAGLEILERAKALGLRTIVDQTDAPVAFEESLLSREREEWPSWEHGTVDSAAWAPMAEREQAEWELADTIVCGSSYVRDGIDAVAGPISRCGVVPYGFDNSAYTVRKKSVADDHPLRVLFVGTLCLRKGIQYVWQAARLLHGRSFHIRVVGPTRLTDYAMQQLCENIELKGNVPRPIMQRQYAWADVLLLPSISEGSAIVCYEALAHGVPVITTYNAGSVVRDGIEGFIVPIRDAPSIVEALSKLASDHALLKSMSEAAVTRAAEFRWEQYSRRLLSAIRRDHAEVVAS